MKVNIKMIKETVKENLLLQMETYMKVNLKMIKETVKENLLLQMETYMKMNLKMVITTVREFYTTPMDRLGNKAHGEMMSSFNHNLKHRLIFRLVMATSRGLVLGSVIIRMEINTLDNF
jgi:hypothetical protein